MWPYILKRPPPQTVNLLWQRPQACTLLPIAAPACVTAAALHQGLFLPFLLIVDNMSYRPALAAHRSMALST
jgi:hypothetical protein